MQGAVNGRVQVVVYAALGVWACTVPPPVIVSLTASPMSVAPGGTITVSADVTNGAGSVLSYAWSLPAGWKAAAGAPTSEPALVLIAPDTFGVTAVVGFTVSDSKNKFSATSQTAVSTLATDVAPIISGLAASLNPVPPGGMTTLVASASSPSGSALTYSWSSSDPGWQISGSASSVSVTAPAIEYGPGTVITVTVVDAAMAKSSASIPLSTDSGRPSIGAIIASPNPAFPSTMMALTVAASSPNGAIASYVWTTSNANWMLGLSTTGTTSIATSELFGDSTIVTVVATDVIGQTVTTSLVLKTVTNLGVGIGPILSSVNPVAPGTPVQLAVAATSSIGAMINYTWTSTNPGFTLIPAGPTATIATPADGFSESAVVRVIATDATGASASSEIVVGTTADKAPVITSASATPNPVEPGGTATLTASAYSPTGSTLTYGWYTNSPGWVIPMEPPDGDILYASGVDYAAQGVVFLTVIDAEGLSTTTQLAVETTAAPPPVISALEYSPSSPQTNQPVQLTMRVTSGGLPVTLGWWIASEPLGSAAAFSPSQATSVFPQFTPDLAGEYVVALSVMTDNNMLSATATTQFVVTAPPVTAVISGPSTALVDTGVKFDGTKSSAPSMGTLRYSWTVVSGPAGAVTAFYADAKLTTPGAAVAQPYFVGSIAGSYIVVLSVTDSLTGDIGTAQATLALTGAPSITLVSNPPMGGWTGTVGQLLPGNPIVFEVVGADGTTPVPNQTVTATALNSYYSSSELISGTTALTTDGNGQVSFLVMLGRNPALPMELTAALAGAASSSASATFTAKAGNAASIALATRVGSTDINTAVVVKAVDSFFNDSADQASISGKVTVAIANSPSGLATLGCSVVGTCAPLSSTSLTLTLASGVAIANVIDPAAEGVSISMTPAGLLTVPLATWTTVVLDSSPPSGNGTGVTTQSGASWTRSANGLPQWSIDTDSSKIDTGESPPDVSSFGLELNAAQAIGTGGSFLGVTVPTGTVSQLSLTYLATVPSANDAAKGCTAQTAFYATMTQSLDGAEFDDSHGAPVQPAGGYPAQQTCAGHGSFSTVSTWTDVTYDMTDAVNNGYGTLQLSGITSSDAFDPEQGSKWYVGEVRWSSLTVAANGAAVSADLPVLSGVAAQLVVFSVPVLDGCGDTIGAQIFVAEADSKLNASGSGKQVTFNPVDGAVPVTISWTGSAVTPSGYTGTLVTMGAGSATFATAGGEEKFTVSDTTAETSTFTASTSSALSIVYLQAKPATGGGFNFVKGSAPAIQFSNAVCP